MSICTLVSNAVSLDGVLASMKDSDAVQTRERAANEGCLSFDYQYFSMLS